MLFEWDEAKNAANKKKHGVGFEFASRVFDDPNHMSEQDTGSTEERWNTIGFVSPHAALFVVHTSYEDEHGEEIIRIISARKATTHEQERYHDRD
jgi:uncharacterized protein